MADISLIPDECVDDSDEGFEQGDCTNGGQSDDAALPPLVRIQKYANSNDSYERVMAGRTVQELFRTIPAENLEKHLGDILVTLISSSDDSMVKVDLLEQIPNIAAAAQSVGLVSKVSGHLIPFVVRNLGGSDTQVGTAAYSALIQLVEQGFISKQQAEIQVCPSILALSKVDTMADVCTRAVTLMSKMAPFLGRDVMERVFLKRFAEMCSSDMFYLRKACASKFGNFCAVIGRDAFEKILLSCYTGLCEDNVWGVRKSCAEVIMFVSSACPPHARRTILAPIFIKLLQDDCRWVKMSAFQTLGPFISTFADPTITNLAYNNGGDLVLVNGDGSEFLMTETNASLPISHDMDMLDLLMNAKKPEDEEEEKNNAFESKNEMQNEEEGGEMLSNALEMLPWLNAHSFGDKLDSSCDELCDVTKSLDHVDINADQVEENCSDRNCNCSLINATNDEEASAIGNNENVAKQVILNIENAKEDDNLHLYNSYNYWYISPDLPLDPDIINGAGSPEKQSGAGDFASRLKDYYISDMMFNNTLDESAIFETKSTTTTSNAVMSAKPPIPTVPKKPDQDVVPQLLIEHFISMTDPDLSKIDIDMMHHCAYSLPAVALTLGRKNWHLLKDTVEALAGDMQYKVRRTVASSLHELALILGPEIATNNLTPLFDGFLKDLDEVKIGILKHLAHFLRLINPAKRSVYLPKFAEFLQTDNELNWRFRQELAKQLRQIVELFRPHEAAKHIGIIAQDLLSDKVSAVREDALLLTTEIVKYISKEHGLTSMLLVKLAERFAHSKKWKWRQTFALLCSELLLSSALPRELFATEVMPHLLDLSWDPVANVRLVVARTIAKHIIVNEYFTDPEGQHFDTLDSVFRRLQADKDQDVRQSAEVTTINSQP